MKRTAVFGGCSLEELRHETQLSTSRAFSIEEAKEFFEKDFIGRSEFYNKRYYDFLDRYPGGTAPDYYKGGTPALSEEYIYELILGPLIEYYEENVPGFSLPAN